MSPSSNLLALPAHRMLGPDYRIVGDRIGCGNFGQVYLGVHVKSGEKVAVKVETSNSYPKQLSQISISLRHERFVLRKLHQGLGRNKKILGFPRLHYFGKCGPVDCMVIDLLGPSLEDLFDYVGRRFNFRSVALIGRL